MPRILVSGSYPQSEAAALSSFVARLSRMIGEACITNDYEIISGLGLTVGPAAVEGAEAVMRLCNHSKLKIFKKPFPFANAPTNTDERQAYFRQHREDLISGCQVAIFISGEKSDGQKVIPAEGIKTEFEMCAKAGIKVIPIGLAGGMSQILWSEVDQNYKSYLPGTDQGIFSQLGRRSSLPDESERKTIISHLFELVAQAMRETNR